MAIPRQLATDWGIVRDREGLVRPPDLKPSPSISMALGNQRDRTEPSRPAWEDETCDRLVKFHWCRSLTDECSLDADPSKPF